ncbi:MAG: DNA-binding protein [Gammaproteobacteria bacterium]|nr:DNA-binding protein [Gammaproteobacteria bacterium]
MGRTGVTLFEVEQAAVQLQGKGKNPSVDAVREILGTGSKSTIAQHLRDWKSTQCEAQGKLPQEVIAFVTGLWERLHGQVEQRVIDIEKASAEQMQTLQQALFQSQQALTQLKKEFHQKDEALAESNISHAALEKNLQAQQHEHAKLLERYHSTQENSKAENARLHQLANNIQANLEHYQQAMQQQRTEQQLANEKQHAQSEKNIKPLQRELEFYSQQSRDFEHQGNTKTLELQQLTGEYETLKSTHQRLLQHVQQQEHTLATLTAASNSKINRKHTRKIL